ncbi:MAG: hypothetical protein AAGE90_11125 [Pseudomonadota bacterium]
MTSVTRGSRPSLKLTATELKRCWIDRLPPPIGQCIESFQVVASRQYFLSGQLVIGFEDAERPGVRHHGLLRFKLTASRSLFGTSRRYVIRHFVSAITPKAVRGRYAAPFLEVVLAWLRDRGFDEVRFQVHSRRRSAAFQRVLRELGYECRVRNRLIFQIIVVALRRDGRW